MRLVPIDILHKRFPRSFRGCRPDAVADFLQEVSAEYEAALAEIHQLKDQVASMERELQRYREMEAALHEALVLAAKAAEDVRSAAEREARLIVEEARTKAEEELEQHRRASEAVQQERRRFVREFRALLTAYLADLDDLASQSIPQDGSALVRASPPGSSALSHEDGSATPAAPGD